MMPLWLALAACALGTSDVGRVPEAFRGFPVLLRCEYPPTGTRREQLAAQGVTGFVAPVARLDAWKDAAGVPLVLADLAPPGTLALTFGEFDRWFEPYFLRRARELTARPFCWNREPTKSELAEAVTGAASAARALRPLGLLLVADPSITFAAEPFDWCACDNCRGAWLPWLDRAYGGLDAVNRAHGATFAAWGDVWPATVDAIRARNEGRPRPAANFAAWLDHRRFLDQDFAGALARLSAAARAAAGGVPAGFAGGAPVNPFGGHDWSLLSRGQDLLVLPDDAVTRALLQSRGGNDRVVLAPWDGAAANPADLRASAARAFLGGARGLLATGWPPRSGGGVGQTPWFDELRDFAAMIRGGPGPALLEAVRDDSGIALLDSPSSRALHWLRATREDGIHWLARGERREGAVDPLRQRQEEWLRALEGGGYGLRMVADDELGAAADPLSGCRALVLPGAIALSDAAAARVRAFAEAGGVVIADGAAGLYDEHGRGRAVGALDDLLGIERSGTEAWDVESWAAPEPPVERPAGQGFAVAGGSADSERLSSWLARAGIAPFARARAAAAARLPAGVRLLQYRSGAGTFLAVHHDGTEAGELALVLELAEARVLDDLTRGSLGDAASREHRVSLSPGEFALFRVR